MILHALRTRLLALWILLLASAAATAYLLVEFYKQSAAVQVAAAEGAVARACRDIGERYAVFVSGRSGNGREIDPTLQTQLTDVVDAALARAPGIEGGIWTGGSGSAAYGFPTYEGTGPKTDLPSAELDTIRRINAEAARSERPVTVRIAARTQSLVLQACPLRGPIPNATAWTMMRVHTDQGPAYIQLLTGLGFLALTVIGSASLLGRLLYVLSRRIGRLEMRLRTHDQDSGDLPYLEPTGIRELDRLVLALNAAGARLAAARQRAASAERLAAVGRMASGVAHEIRNPLAAMRLKAENALASRDPIRSRAALTVVLEQIDRMDRLLRDLLSLIQPRPPALAPTDIADVLAASARLHEELAGAKRIRIEIVAPALARADQPCLDEGQIRRAADNLILNAVQNCPEGALVRVTAARAGDRLRIAVEDTGPGVPDALRARLFEPFVTGRPDGTGLGLAIVREIARAHGGEARLEPGGPGATFELDLPWQPS
ncbi:sensor histidine kinase [Methylobacterium nodulans]|uniref:histidine kinase n=1 Tax=Methylobacterium nodulans (strain LMG 21967 / CNCM I-2342 / ORS 2060) TaxID=460265 RepID=B8IB90_METNO|nr:ATP-binding protein [Methylobacterium nodulans]ACL57305.1 histidine kinase [Methylobacterium nodulans ORS 2060]